MNDGSPNLVDTSSKQIELPVRSNIDVVDVPKLEQVDSLIKHLKPQKYAATKPKIVLEVISARTAILILALTYISFAFCMSLDIYAVYEAFALESLQISPTLIQPSQYNETYTFNTTISNLIDIFSIQIVGTQYGNSTDVKFGPKTLCSETSFTYKLQLWGCYEPLGCGNRFVPIPTLQESSTVWQKVYFSDDITQSVSICANSDISSQFLRNTFQPQVCIHLFIYLSIHSDFFLISIQCNETFYFNLYILHIYAYIYKYINTGISSMAGGLTIVLPQHHLHR